jgi:hypothetical protein
MPLLGFVVVALLAIAVYLTSNRRSRTEEPRAVALPSPPIAWTKDVAVDSASPSERIELAGRLRLVGDARSIALLEAALADESNPDVREAVWRALLAIRMRE